MKKEDIDLTDWYRILLGEVPPVFYIELIIRGLFVFLVLTFGMKYLGKRVSSQLTRLELAGTATLAAATGLVLLAPDRGLLPPIVIVLLMIGVQRFLRSKANKNEKFEFLMEGHLSELVRDGTLNIKAMRDARISKEQLFAQLRQLQINHLGEISRVYMEANGDFTAIKRLETKPGLSVIPGWDEDFFKPDEKSGIYACNHCGKTEATNDHPCSNCKHQSFTKAIKKSKS